MSCAMCWISIIIDQVALELERKSTPTYAVKTLFYYSSNGGIRLYMAGWQSTSKLPERDWEEKRYGIVRVAQLAAWHPRPSFKFVS